MDCGAANFIAPGALLEELVEAIRMSSSDGIYIDRKNFLALCEAANGCSRGQMQLEKEFTNRQLAIAQAMRRGERNKKIADDLNLSESTVKVHVNYIMKKLNASNRTQAAYRLNALSQGED
jgi:DNA-binding NarL/FixJ family response regulator